MKRALVSVLLCTALAAEEPAVEVGFGNHYRVGPVPIRVPLANDGPDEEGDLVVEVSAFLDVTRYVAPVFLPRGSKKSIVVHVAMSTLNAPIKIEWRPRGRPSRELPVPSLSCLTPADRLVLCASGDPVQGVVVLPGLVGRSTGGGNVYCHSVEPALVPEVAHALSSVDLVYLRRVGDRDLTTTQIEALAAWIDAGGHLLLSGETADVPALARFLPGEISGRCKLDHFDVFSKLFAAVKATPSEIAVLVPEAGAEVLCREGEVPLITTARRGAGRVTMVAFDPLVEPFLSSPGLGVLWDALLKLGRRRASPYDDPILRKGVVDVLSTRQGPTLSTVIAGAAVVVVFLVGLRWVARRAAARPDRLAFAVFCAPTLAVAMAVVSWILGSFTRGGDRLDSVVFIEAAPGAQTGVVTSFDAFYHHVAGRYHEEPSARNALCVAEVSEIFDLRRRVRYAWRQGPVPCLADVEFFPNSTRIFRTIAEIDVGEGVRGDLELRAEGLAGEVVNGTPWDWEETWVLTNHQQARIGPVRRGDSARAPIELETAVDAVGVVEMARGGRMREGILERLGSSWDWPPPSSSTPKDKGDLLLVAFVRTPPMWREREGRGGTRETVLIAPLLGRDASEGEERK